jgi:phosphatidylserine/phosphatidylglycerophosphate/cardiolipin synthase-like enzyme
MKKIIWLILLFLPSVILADTFAPNASYQVCFTPQENCTKEITDEIAQAKKQILVQAYTFNSRLILKSLAAAAKNGIQVEVLLDKTAITDTAHYSPVKFFQQNNILTRIDYQPSIAHNKVIIIDGNTVITGSFNFTYSAQKYNAENVLIIHDVNLAQKYLKNWYERYNLSN